MGEPSKVLRIDFDEILTGDLKISVHYYFHLLFHY